MDSPQFHTSTDQKQIKAIKHSRDLVHLLLPFIWGVKLHCYHIEGVPWGDADATKQAQERNHPWFTVAEHQEEAAHTRYDTGSRWRDGRELHKVKKPPWP